MPKCWSLGIGRRTGAIKGECQGAGRKSRKEEQEKREFSEMRQVLQKSQVEIKWKRGHPTPYVGVSDGWSLQIEYGGQDGLKRR